MDNTIYIDTTTSYEDSSISSNSTHSSISNNTSMSPEINIDTSKPIGEDHPDYFEGDKQAIGAKYPVLAPHLANSVVSFGKPTGPNDDRQLEFYHPWDSENPNPGKNSIEIFNRDLKGDDLHAAIAGDLLHRVGSVDPTTGLPVDAKFYQLRQELANSRDDLHRNMDRQAYEREKNSPYPPGEYGKWFQHSRLDAYVRAGLFPEQNPNWQEALTPEMKPIFDKMQSYLKGEEGNKPIEINTTSSESSQQVAIDTSKEASRTEVHNITWRDALQGALYGKDAMALKDLPGFHENGLWPERLIVGAVHGIASIPGEVKGIVQGMHGVMTNQIEPNEPAAIQTALKAAIGMVFSPAASGIKTDATYGSFLPLKGATPAQRDKLFKAMDLKDAGSSAEAIWQKTGWFQSDGKWLFRLADNDMKLRLKPTELQPMTIDAAGKTVADTTNKPSLIYELPNETPIDQIVNHKALFDKLPELKDMKIRSMNEAEQRSMDPKTAGFLASDGTVVFRPTHNLDDIRNTVIHEITHKVQEIAGITEGTAPSSFLSSAYHVSKEVSTNAMTRIETKMKNLVDSGKWGGSLSGDDVAHVAQIALKAQRFGGLGKATLTAEEKMIYTEMVKHNLTGDLKTVGKHLTLQAEMEKEAFDKYWRSRGEVMARTVEQEMHLTKQELKDLPPTQSLQSDVKFENQLDRQGNPVPPQSVIPPKDFPKELKGSNENTSPRISNTGIWDRLANQQKGKDVWAGIKESLGNLRSSLSEKVFGKSEIRPNRPANENIKFDAQTMGNSDRAYLDGIDQLLKMSNKEFFEKMHDPKTLEMLKKNPVGEKKLSTFIDEIEKLQKPTLSKYEEALQRQKDKLKPK